VPNRVPMDIATIGGTGIKKVLGTATTDRNLAVNCTLVKRGRPCRARKDAMTFVQLTARLIARHGHAVARQAAVVKQ
jgi:hypothetical protein